MADSFGRGADYAQLSNIFFIENEKDPWHVGTDTVASAGGVNGSVRRIVAAGGAHHQDLRFSSEYDAADVSAARKAEREAMRGWLARGAPIGEAK
jgi:hypothetical protein